MSALPARDGYRLWAPLYERDTPVSVLEHQLVERLGGRVEHCRLLDVGCGTGRRLPGAGASLAVGVDVSPEMLARGAGRGRLTAGDVRALPVRSGTFEVVWCRLVVGHVADLAAAYAELVRVCRPGGRIVVTDFHPDAVAAGHRRTFRDRSGLVHEIEHHVHTLDDHARTAGSLGLTPAARGEGPVGHAVRRVYAAAGRLDAYQDQLGLKLVLALVYTRSR